MSASENRGSFVWYDLMTTDPQAAMEFYGKVIGWKTQPFGDGNNHYVMWVGSQGPLGGVVQLPEEAKKMGAGPHWMTNVTVADVDRSVERVKALGGQVHVPPSDIPTVGRFAVVADPQGASISLFTPSSHMAQHDSTKHGEFSWNELLTSDHKAAFKFYSEIFGWERTDSFDMGAMGEYLMYGQAGKTLGGMFTKTPDMPMPPAWIFYIHVDDLKGAMDRATEAGGTLVNGPHEVPGGDWIAQFMDPQGAVFALHSKANPS